MATLKQKQTAVNKILRINKKSYSSKAELFSSALVDDKTNQYYFCDYMGVKTSEKIIDEQDLKLLDFENYNSIGILMPYRPSEKTVEIFAKRDKEFRYVD